MTTLQLLRYSYYALNRDEFRLIRLLPASSVDEPIRCELWTCSINNAPPYEAISYVWGSPDSISKISIDGFGFGILANLYAALRRLRLSTHPRILWADAICINQEDIMERNHQTGIMGKIFRSAENVCVWLGEENEESGSAILLLRELNHMTDMDDVLRGSRYEQGWAALAALTSRTWFKRMWVVQEIALARRATIHCGSSSAHWAELETGVSLLKKRSDIYPETVRIPDLATRRLVFSVRNAFQRGDLGENQHPLFSLEALVTQLSPLDCSDPRDKIYALLGLAEDSEHCLSPNYGKPCEEVYKHFVKYSIAASASLDIIMRRWAPPGAAWSAPSWVCTIDNNSFDSVLQFVNANTEFISDDSMRSRRYNASGKWKPEKWWEIQDELNTLHVKIFCLDVIESVSSIAGAEGMPEDWLEFGLDSPYSGPDAFWRTLLADTDPMGTTSPPDDYKELLAPILSRSEHLESTPRGEGTKTSALHSYSAIPSPLLQHMRAVIWNRTLAGTRDRHLLALVPGHARPGDIVCILYGCTVPVVLRQYDNGFFGLVGESYVHGIMDGEALKGDESDGIQEIIIDPARVEGNGDKTPRLRHPQAFQLSRVLHDDKDAIAAETFFDETLSDTSKVSKPYADGAWRQFRVHWNSPEGYQGSDLITELRPGSVKGYADRLRKEGVRVTLEEVGITDPVMNGIKTLASLCRISLNNLITTSKASILGLFGGTPSTNPTSQSSTQNQQAHQPAPQVATRGGRASNRDDFLLLCINDSSYLTTRNDINVAPVVSDQQLFHIIRQQYFSRRKRLANLVSFKSIQRITFVKFALRENNEVDCLQPDNVPPLTETHYELFPWPPGHIPPIGNSYLMRRFKTPRACRDSSFCLRQFPKRIQRRPQRGVPPDFETGWGLHFQEGYDFEKVVALLLLGVIISLVIGIVWSVHHTVADGFQIAGYIITAWALGITTLQFVIGTP